MNTKEGTKRMAKEKWERLGIRERFVVDESGELMLEITLNPKVFGSLINN